MRDVLEQLTAWWRAGQAVGMGTVVGTWGSAPRAAGAAMLVGPDGSAVGSVSGGCVESDVYALAEQVLASGVPTLQRYGVMSGGDDPPVPPRVMSGGDDPPGPPRGVMSDADAHAIGLTCGGVLDVFVERVCPRAFPELGGVCDDVAAGRPVGVATVVEHLDPARVGRRLVVRPVGGGAIEGSLGSERADAAVLDDSRGLLAAGASELLTYGPDGERRGEGMRVFVASHAPPPRMLVFGAIDFAAAVARLGSFVGYAVTVCDARPVFSTAARLPDAAEVVVDWPHRYLAAESAAGRVGASTVVCVLTHDPKFDVPLLDVALRLPRLGYVGAMGSRHTDAERRRQLRDCGLDDEQLSRLSSPIGLDLGARTPEETALSIVAEIVGLRWGGTGARLATLDSRIHP